MTTLQITLITIALCLNMVNSNITAMTTPLRYPSKRLLEDNIIVQPAAPQIKEISSSNYFSGKMLPGELVYNILFFVPPADMASLIRLNKYLYDYHKTILPRYIKTQQERSTLSTEEITKIINSAESSKYRTSHTEIFNRIKSHDLSYLQEKLGTKEINLYYTDKDKNSFLHRAIIAENTLAKIRFETKFLVAQALVNIPDKHNMYNIQNKNGETPLMLVKNIETFNLLADKTDLTLLNNKQENAAHVLLNTLHTKKIRQDIANFFFDQKNTLEEKDIALLYKVFADGTEENKLFLEKILKNSYSEKEYEEHKQKNQEPRGVIRRLNFDDPLFGEGIDFLFNENEAEIPILPMPNTDEDTESEESSMEYDEDYKIANTMICINK